VTAVALTVHSLGGTCYRVTDPAGSGHSHAVDLAARPVCDCKDFAFRGQARPCKHIRAAVAFRDADPQGKLLDALSEKDTLDLIDQPPRRRGPETPDPDAVTIAEAALAAWRRELREGKRTPTTFDGLWVAASAATHAREAQATPSIAAGWYALARAVVEMEAVA
jgi:hypothetical protein